MTTLRRTYQVGGMDCPQCATSLERMACSLPGVVSASVHFATAKMQVEYEVSDSTGIDQIVRRAGKLGFSLTEENASVSQKAWPLFGVQNQAIFAAILLALGLILEHGTSLPDSAAHGLYLSSMVAGGTRFFLAGLSGLRSRTLGTHLLVCLAAIGAILIGQWEEGAMVVTLYAVGMALEGAAMERTRRSLRDLIAASPTEATLPHDDGRLETVAAEVLRKGDRILVQPGARIPADGRILAGYSSLNEAPLTGESLLKDKGPGDPVLAGSINGNGTLTVEVTASAYDSAFGRLVRLVEEAHSRKAPMQARIERFGQVYTPLVLVTALLVGAIGPLVAPGKNWVYQALTLLVVACPCALVIATPVAYVCAIARAARQGALVKGGVHLESLAAVRHLFFDKTGTLTTGAPEVTDVRTACGSPEAERSLLALAAAVEQSSEHPIARAIVQASAEIGLPLFAATDAQALPGRGVTARVKGQEVCIGNRLLMEERGISLPSALDRAEHTLRDSGKTTLLVAVDGTAQGVLAVADTVRPEAALMIASLKRQERDVTLLTGDNPATARQVGNATGITAVYAGLLPEDKLSVIQAANGKTALVGDGINDAPALAAATVGVAMGESGTAAAVEAADIALLRDDLTLVPWIIRLAEATDRVVRTNIAIASIAIVLLLAGTLTGRLSLPLGILGHEGSALLVIANGLRLLSPRFSPLRER